MTALPTNSGPGLLPEPLAKVLGNPSQTINKLDSFLGTPGGGFLMNLLAQSGRSLTPGPSPLGAIGRAGLANQQQQRQSGIDDLQKRLIESTIGLRTAQTDAAGLPDQGKPLTDLAKLRADFNAGRITADAFESSRKDILRAGKDKSFDMTKSLRGEFRTDTDGIRQSQSALANAKSLVAQGNPIAATAAFTSFIRSIDNSVVRPAEQAAYSSAGGIARRLEDELSKLSGEGPLSENTRRDLLTSIETLENQLSGIHDRTVKFYNEEADLAELRPESVTGIPSVTSPSVTIPESDPKPPDPSQEAATIQSDIERLEAEIAELENASR